MKKIIAWGGFLNGKLDSGNLPFMAIFRLRSSAKVIYEDVRKVEIKVLTPHH